MLLDELGQPISAWPALRRGATIPRSITWLDGVVFRLLLCCPGLIPASRNQTEPNVSYADARWIQCARCTMAARSCHYHEVDGGLRKGA